MYKISLLIYTDGSCMSNPGSGGWSVLTKYDSANRIVFGKTPRTTNNRMELYATVNALRHLKISSNVIVYSDSQYVVKGITHWSLEWQYNNWLTAGKNFVVNQDLWKALINESKRHFIRWYWVKAHHKCFNNHFVDQVARLQ